MKYGIRWYVADGDHDYTEEGFSEHSSLLDLLTAMMHRAVPQFGEELLFQALVDGRQDTIHWLTDDYGFELYTA